mmetsp:Transcript_802/g.1918  ORF Transcript_802/g.1918 Transcript_802/m.1918 type:complete len:112 (+) Transcript_802:525-860(+)
MLFTSWTVLCLIVFDLQSLPSPRWFRSAGVTGTMLLYQPEPEPVQYIIPVTHVLGRLPLIPVGDGKWGYSLQGVNLRKSHHPFGQAGVSLLYIVASWLIDWVTESKSEASD